MCRKHPAIFCLIFVKRTIKGVVNTNSRVVSCFHKVLVAFIGTHVKPYYLKPCHVNIANDRLFFFYVIPYITNFLNKHRIQCKNSRSRSCLKNLLIFVQTLNSFFSERQKNKLKKTGKRIMSVYRPLYLLFSPIGKIKNNRSIYF